MNKGIVMEVGEGSIIVMNASGRFDQLPRGNRNCVVGEEILYAGTKPRRRVPFIAAASGLVAAVVLGLVLVTGLSGNKANGEVVAYVSIDINPSVEMGIDMKEIVRDLRGLNTDGINLIDSLNYQGKKLDVVTADILDKAEQGALAKGEGDIIISSTVVQGTTKVNDETIADQLKQQVTKHIADAHPAQVQNYEVTAFAAPPELREEAKVSGVSAGKYAVYLNALNNGTKVSLDEIQNLSIHQIAKDNGGINKVIDPAQPISKKSLKQLLDDEKSGKLSEKVQQMKDNTNGKSGKSDKSGSTSDKNNSKIETTSKPVSSKVDNNDNKGRKDDKKPIPSNTPSGNNDSNQNNTNIKNDNNNKNDSNNTNNKNNNNNNKNDNGSNNKDDQSSSKATLSPSPSRTPSPTPKPGGGSDSRSDSNNNRDNGKQDNKGKQGDQKKDDSNNQDSNKQDSNKEDNSN
jgi:hypothetical protein